jgi:two-component system, chemotaxis family, chemotaxis protein CheY
MPKLIFVVEDDNFIRSDMAEILEMQDYNVKSFANGREALDSLLASTALPSLIILDLMMPVMNGYEFLTAIDEVDRLKQLAILVVSADRQAKAQLPKNRAKAVLVKPIDLDMFIETVATCAE